ncbi:MAG: hypothetical protein ABIE74_11910, partial [Pseudomonadota bacterium]
MVTPAAVTALKNRALAASKRRHCLSATSTGGNGGLNATQKTTCDRRVGTLTTIATNGMNLEQRYRFWQLYNTMQSRIYNIYAFEGNRVAGRASDPNVRFRRMWGVIVPKILALFRGGRERYLTLRHDKRVDSIPQTYAQIHQSLRRLVLAQFNQRAKGANLHLPSNVIKMLYGIMRRFPTADLPQIGRLFEESFRLKRPKGKDRTRANAKAFGLEFETLMTGVTSPATFLKAVPYAYTSGTDRKIKIWQAPAALFANKAQMIGATRLSLPMTGALS